MVHFVQDGRTYFVATVHLLVEARNDAEASDAVSGLLSEGGDKTGIADWSYLSGPQAVTLPPNYEEGDFLGGSVTGRPRITLKDATVAELEAELNRRSGVS